MMKAFLGSCILLQVITIPLAVYKLPFHSHSVDSTDSGRFQQDNTTPSKANNLRYRSRRDTPNSPRDFKEGGALNVVNAPNALPWKVANRDGPPTKVVPVDFSYVYNPSVLELSNGYQIFAGRMSWLYGGDCHQYAHLEDPHAMYNCLSTHKERFADQTVIGLYHPAQNELEVISPSNDKDRKSVLEFAAKNEDIASWNGGPGWFDTRLLYPYNHRYRIDEEVSKQKKILMTSQNTELLGNDDWFELHDASTLALQVSYIGVFEPDMITDGPQANHIDWTRTKKMSRWLFYDADVEREEFEKRQHGMKWTPMVADIARLKCKVRKAHLPALPFHPEESAMHFRPGEGHSDVSKTPVAHIGSYHNTSSSVSSTHRRLAALEGDDWVTIKDKNWNPFAYKQRLLWSYSLEPHVVCENDIDLNQVEKNEDIDCVLCVAKYESSSSVLFNKFYSRINADGFDNVKSHLNGAPAYYIEHFHAYLGIMHIIKTEDSYDPVGRRIKKRIYEHYMYMTEPEPPFRVIKIANEPVPIQRSRCWSPWFEIDDIVDAEFVMYMQYHPDRPGRELVLSYGDGDRYSRVDTFGLSEVLETFQ